MHDHDDVSIARLDKAFTYLNCLTLKTMHMNLLFTTSRKAKDVEILYILYWYALNVPRMLTD